MLIKALHIVRGLTASAYKEINEIEITNAMNKTHEFDHSKHISDWDLSKKYRERKCRELISCAEILSIGTDKCFDEAGEKQSFFGNCSFLRKSMKEKKEFVTSVEETMNQI